MLYRSPVHDIPPQMTVDTFFSKSSARRLFCISAALCLVFLFHNSAVSQTAALSGVVNTYAKVTAINAKSITLNSAAGFAAGDRVLIIQMDGAAINLANSAAYGAVTNYNGTGSYELATVGSVQGKIVTLKSNLINTYESSQAVQLIRVPSLTDATVTGTLSAQPWNGSTGGVVAVLASGALTFNADINVNDAGFRGGATDVVNGNFNGGNRTCETNYFYTSASSLAASKGEGIALLATQNGYPAGKGSNANAGGGANSEEGGGGGGGNYGTGGNGGAYSGSTNCPFCGGIGGGGLTYSNAFNRIYMGGGGGGGHTDDNGMDRTESGGAGANGAGIVIIQADTIIGNGHTIYANGSDAPYATEGTGGGGAGGTVLLDAQTYVSSLNVQMNGGAGGSNQNDEQNFRVSECSGSGGGGAGGLLWVSNPKVDPNVAYSVTGGVTGNATAADGSDCSGSQGYPGQPGGVLTKLVIPKDAASILSTANICVSVAPTAAPPLTPVTVAAFLSDSIASSVDSITFDLTYLPAAMELISTSRDTCFLTKDLTSPGVLHVTLTACPAPLKSGILFSAIFNPLVSAKDTTYTAINVKNIQVYPPLAVQMSGCSVPFTVLPICGLTGVLYVGSSAMAQNYPNPFTDRTTIPLALSRGEIGAAQLKIFNVFGKQVADLSAQANSGSSSIELDGKALPTGVYACVLQTPSTKVTRQLFVVH